MGNDNKKNEEMKDEKVETKEKDQKNENDASAEKVESNDNTDNGESKDEPIDELTIAKEKIKELEDKYKRLLAEFDNFRKRSEKENIQMCDIGASVALTKILPIVDNIERALANIPEDLKGNAFVEGVDKTYKQVLKTFEELDVKAIESVGKPFDTRLHNAVMTEENGDAEVDTITEELQKGYTYKEQVLRPAMVKVKK